ncbi:MAG: hypothetical protein AAB308_06880, partial [Nitrospirota bacterium]
TIRGALRSLKTAFQRGRSEREPEVYASRHVEELTKTRTQFGERRVLARRCGQVRRGSFSAT